MVATSDGGMRTQVRGDCTIMGQIIIGKSRGAEIGPHPIARQRMHPFHLIRVHLVSFRLGPGVAVEEELYRPGAAITLRLPNQRPLPMPRPLSVA